MCLWRSGKDQCLILTPCCHCAESEIPRSVTVRHIFFPMWKGQGPSRARLQMLLLKTVAPKCHRSEATQDIGWQIAGGSQVMKFTS